MTMIPIPVVTRGRTYKSMVKRLDIRERINTIQTTSMIISAREL